MADKRAFAAFDVGYLDNPKIMDIFDASPIAVCMHFASVLYCAQHLTDGVIALRAMQRKVGGGSEDSDLLVDAGLWHLPGHDCRDCPDVPAGKAYVHDYLEHNRTSDGVKKKSNDGKKAAEARWEKKKADAERNATRMQDASEPHSDPQCENNGSAMPRQTDRQTSKSLSSEVADATPRPDVEQLLNLLDQGIEANGAKKPTRTKKNTDAARLLLDRDGWTVEQVSWMIRWATRDEFWRRNILSMSKLREKFDQLKLQSGAGKSIEEINPDKVLGPDYWTPPQAPSGLSIQDEMAWKRDQAKAHREERLAEAMRKVSA